MGKPKVSAGMLIKAIFGIDDIKIFWRIRERLINSDNNCNTLSRRLLNWSCKIIRRRYGSGIPITEDIKPFFTPHGFYGIFISQGAIIGTGCTIYQQVTVGSNTLANSGSIGIPTIGSNCLIGAGAKIIGSVNIGDNVRIGANAIVVDDVPSNSTVVLEKPRVILHKEILDNTLIPLEEIKKVFDMNVL